MSYANGYFNFSSTKTIILLESLWFGDEKISFFHDPEVTFHLKVIIHFNTRDFFALSPNLNRSDRFLHMVSFLRRPVRNVVIKLIEVELQQKKVT